jgi:hypothetical protein
VHIVAAIVELLMIMMFAAHSDKMTKFFDSTTAIMSGALTNVVTRVIATSSRYYSHSTMSGNNIHQSVSASILSYAVVALTSSLLLVQLTTSSNPIGQCYLFLKQLRRQVSYTTIANDF